MSLDIQTDPAGVSELAAKTMVLATDLDGTFLGGSDDARTALYRWIEDNRDTVGLIFVTGRDPEFIQDLCHTACAPWPDYVVGDVGTTIAVAGPDHGVRPIPDLETPIAEAWNNSGARVRAALDGIAGLRLQDTAFRHRVSYDLDSASFDPVAKERVEALGLDWLISDDRFFDVLPKGYSKGPALRMLLAELGVAPGSVLAAGDTLNDFTLLTCGVPAVAVGNSEAALKSALAGDGDIFHAKGEGAAGIAEAIQTLNLHPTGALINAK